MILCMCVCVLCTSACVHMCAVVKTLACVNFKIIIMNNSYLLVYIIHSRIPIALLVQILVYWYMLFIVYYLNK